MPIVTVKMEVSLKSAEIRSLLELNDGSLIKYAEDSSHTVYFKDNYGCVQCPNCAQDALFRLEEAPEPISAHTVKEKFSIFCRYCQKEMRKKP